MEFTENDLNKILSEITPPNIEIFRKAKDRLDSLVKPPGSLGVLEELAMRLAAVTGEIYFDIKKRAVIIMASDNGVVDEGVAAAPQQVTYAQTINFTRGITGVAVLAECYGADLIVYDVGVNGDINVPGVIDRKIRKSTGNIAREPAMTHNELLCAIKIGIDAASDAKNSGYKIIGAGEMGIGNTTTSSAVLCALMGYETEDEIRTTAGKGAGLTEEGYEKKILTIKKALALHDMPADDPLEALRCVGGFDIAAMTGVYIGAAYHKIPVVADGFISAVAAFCAVKMNPVCGKYIFMSHHSYERGFKIIANELGREAPLRMNMRLGEGSGCPLMFTIMDGAAAVIKKMATFAEASVTEEYLDNIKDMEKF